MMRVAATLTLTALIGCSQGVPQAEHDEVVAERDKLQAEVEKLRLAAAGARRGDSAGRAERSRSRGRGGPVVQADAETIDAWLAEAKISRDSKLGATLQTSMGDIGCELWPDAAPLTVANFVGLAEGTKAWTDPKTQEEVTGKPLYDGTIFHRVIPNFMIQGGDPMGNGRGGPGYRFADETDNGKVFDRSGLLAMANAGKDTNGSQFFITVRDTPHLNGKHTIFGSCSGEAIEAIVNTPATRSRPNTDVVIKHIQIERK